jgi:hypothetical protein
MKLTLHRVSLSPASPFIEIISSSSLQVNDFNFSKVFFSCMYLRKTISKNVHQWHARISRRTQLKQTHNFWGLGSLHMYTEVQQPLNARFPLILLQKTFVKISTTRQILKHHCVQCLGRCNNETIASLLSM